MTETSSGPSKGIRWWPLGLVALAVVGTLAWNWEIREAASRQDRVVTTETALTFGGVASLVWLFFLSRLSWRAKGATLGIIALLVGAFFATFRYVGVDGDLVPLFEWRWRKVEAVRTGVQLSGIAGDYPGFLGPTRDGSVSGVRLLQDWERSEPQLVWRRAVGVGWSGFAVAGNAAVTQEQHGDEERIVCYDLATGEPRWSIADEVAFRSNLAGDGPRATPTLYEGRVYALGATGRLSVIELNSGTRVWSRDVLADSEGEVPSWGMSSSPLIHGANVIVTAGKEARYGIVAYAREDGKPVWSGGNDGTGYASPLVASLAGREQLIVFGGRSIAGHDPASGATLWTYPWRDRQPNVAQPLPVGKNQLLVSSGYGVGSQLLEITAGIDGSFSAQRVWKSLRFKSKFANYVLHGGHVYGLDDGVLACIDVTTGRRTWRSGSYGHGQVILLDNALLVMDEMGDIILVALDPEEHRELARTPIIDGKVWNPPALAGSRLLMRNDREAALFLLPIQ